MDPASFHPITQVDSQFPGDFRGCKYAYECRRCTGVVNFFPVFVARTTGRGHLAGEKHQGKGQASGEDKSTRIIFLKLFLQREKKLIPSYLSTKSPCHTFQSSWESGSSDTP